MDEVSAGGVVIEKGRVLTLKKYQGDWVLPKGRVEDGESREEAALREVYEETGIEGELKGYIGYLKYNFTTRDGKRIRKTVYYYLMKNSGDGEVFPQKEEGFVDAIFLEPGKALDKLSHIGEKNMVIKALEMFYEEREDGICD